MDIKTIISSIDEIAEKQEELYKHLHSHPELSFEETETAKLMAEKLTKFGYEVQHIGGGVAGILRNGEGPVVLFRADMDAVPIKETTGLPYASNVEVMINGIKAPVMHACGHDMHMATGIGAAWAMANNKDGWSGTYIALFQPAEETGSGSQAMLDDGLIDKIPKPDIALSQHVLATPKAGSVGICAGPFLSTAASMRITVYGKGAHGSMPHMSVDTLVLASSIVMRLQGVVAREIDPFEFAVLTVGSLQAGIAANSIPEEATLLLNLRAYKDEVREKLIEAIKRIVKGECEASGSPKEPEFEIFNIFPPTINDADETAKVEKAFRDFFGDEKVITYKPMTASEDFSNIPNAFGIPYVYWGFGAFEEGQPVLPNHNPGFAPSLKPALEIGTQAAILAVMAYLGKAV